MYPSLDKEEVLRAAQAVHDAVLKGTKRHGKERQPEPMFYINRVDRKLDWIGSGGEPSCYHVIPFSEGASSGLICLVMIFLSLGPPSCAKSEV